MGVDRGRILAVLVIAVVLSLAACVEHFDPTGPPDPPEENAPDGGELRAGQVYSGGMLVRLV